MPPSTVVTLGCRLNAFESDVIGQRCETAGLDDAVIVNTCAVTAEAVRQAAQTIRRARRDHPQARLIVTGCAAEIEPQRFAAMAEIDHVIGNVEKLTTETFAQLGSGSAPRLSVAGVNNQRPDVRRGAKPAAPTATLGARTALPRARAYVQIQNGCDHRCTFCIIPQGRGPSRSVPVAQVIGQVRSLVERGVQEVVLTGVDLTAYGEDQAEVPAATMSLGRLVRQIIRQLPELARLRLSSIDQVEVDRHLLVAIAEEPRLMPHLHLSLQAGHDLILKRMKRRHRRADAVAFCNRVRRLRPDLALGADLIAGFPTETEAMFEQTLALIEDCGLVFLHVFPFSPRPGTPAARMPQLPRQLVKARAARLREAAGAALRRWLDQHRDATLEVHIERRCGDRLLARAPNFAEVLIANAPVGLRAGNAITAQVTGRDGTRLVAEAKP